MKCATVENALITLMAMVELGSALRNNETGKERPSNALRKLDKELLNGSLFCAESVALGPDRFPYLLAARRKQAFPTDHVRNLPAMTLVSRALTMGVGLAIFSKALDEQKPLETLTLGEAYSVTNGSWPTVDLPLPILGPRTAFSVGTPSTAVIPIDLRKKIHEFLASEYSIIEPKLALVAVQRGEVYQPPFMIAPNLSLTGFESTQSWENAIGRLSWFIPPNFPVIKPPASPETFEKWFEGLEPIWGAS